MSGAPLTSAGRLNRNNRAPQGRIRRGVEAPILIQNRALAPAGAVQAENPGQYNIRRRAAFRTIDDILQLPLRSVGDSGEAERSFRKESERHSGMIPNAIGA